MIYIILVSNDYEVSAYIKLMFFVLSSKIGETMIKTAWYKISRFICTPSLCDPELEIPDMKFEEKTN